MRPKVNIYTVRDELSVALRAHVAKLASMYSTEYRRFFIALSGGSVLDIMFSSLNSGFFHNNSNWSSWHIFWADERCVPWKSPESNYGHAKHRFFSQVHIPDEQIHAADYAFNPSESAQAYETVIKEVFQPREGEIPRFDLILLGVGEDGHTASLFPDHSVLKETGHWIVPVLDAPKPPPTRITMTLPLINNARNVVFVASGTAKANIVSKVLNSEAKQPKLPAQMVNPTNGELMWFIDRAAAAKLCYSANKFNVKNLRSNLE